MHGVTKTVGLAAILIIGGCAAFEPLREQTNDQRLAMFKNLSGTYRVVDARQNTNKYDSMTVLLADRNGSLTASTGGAKRTFKLVRCELANQAQASNMGDPVESVEDLVRCDVASDYKYARFYVGKVKSESPRRQ